MTKEKRLIRRMLGPSRRDIRALAFAVQEAEALLFSRKIPIEEILVMRDIYPVVAKKLSKSPDAVARQVERLGNLCWDGLNEEGRRRYLGEARLDIGAPRDMIFYLAYYSHYEKGYFALLRENPELVEG